MKTTKQLFTPALRLTGFALALLVAATASAATITWKGTTSTNWNTAGNWSNSVPLIGDDVVFDGTGINVGSIGLSGLAPQKTITFTAGQTTPVTIYTTAGTAFITNNSASTGLTVAAGSGNHKIIGTGTGTSGTSRDYFFNGSLSSYTFNIGSGATFEINGRLGGGSTSSTFTKSGDGTLIFSGNNGGTSAWQFNNGGFNVNQGAVRLANTTAYGNSGNNYSIASGAALELSGGFTQTINNGTITLNGTGISSAGALRNLSGNNLITGTNVNGTVILGTTPSIGADAGSLTLGVVVGGSGSLTKVGAGELILTKTNTFTGSTTISAGILNVGNLALQNSRLDTAASIAGDANNGLKTSATGLTLGGLTGNKNLADVFTTAGGYSGVTGLTLNPRSGLSVSYSGSIADGAAGMILIKSGAGTQVLSGINTYSGTTTINAGKLQGVTGGSCASSTLILNAATATNSVSITDNSLGWTNAALTASAAGVLEFDFGAVTPSATVSPFIVNGAADFTAATPTVRVVVASALAPGTYPLMTWGSSSGTAPTNVSVSAVLLGTSPSLTVTGNTLNLVIAQAIVVKANNTDDLTNTTSWVGGVLPGAGDLAKWDATVTGANTTVLGADTSWAGIRITNPGGLVTINPGYTLTLGGAIDMSTATAGLTLNCDVALGAANAWNVTNSQTLTVSGAITGANALTKQGAGTLVLAGAGANTFAGPLTIADGTVQLSGSDDRVPTNCAVTLTNAAGTTLDLNGLNQTLAALNGGGAAGGNVSLGAGNLTVNGAGGSFAGVISGAGAVIKSGTGTQVLSGANVHAGGIQVQAGTLTLANATGSGAGSGSVLVSTNATLRLGNGGANGSVSAGTITNDGYLVLNRSDDLTFTNLITGLGEFTKENTNNTVTIATANSYSGNTIVNAGALRISHADALGDTNGVTTILNDPTARLELTGNLTLLEPLTIWQKGAAAGNAPVVLNLSGTNTLAAPITLAQGGSYWIIHSAAGNLIVSGPTTVTTTSNLRWLWLSGAGSGEWNTGMPNGISSNTNGLRKDGVGTWKLGSTVTYSGPTIVSNGTLVVNGTIANSTNVTVAGGTLAGTGSILGPVTVNAAGTLAPGDGGIGKLSVSNLTLNGTTTVELAKTGPTVTNDQVSVQGTLTFGGTLNVSLTGTVSGGEVFQLFTAGTFATNTFSVTNLPSLPGSLTWDTSNLATGVLAVSGGSAPTLNVAQSGDVLTFTWSAAGYKLQSQTNTLNVGLATNWFDYPGGGTSPVLVTNNPANGSVFFRLTTP